MSDTDMTLEYNGDLGLYFCVCDFPWVSRYDIVCDGAQVIAQAIRNSDGTYTTKVINDQGVLQVDQENLAFDTSHSVDYHGKTIHFMPVKVKLNVDTTVNHTFVPIIRTTGNDIDGNVVENTYGGAVEEFTDLIAAVNITIDNPIKSEPWGSGTTARQAYAADFTTATYFSDLTTDDQSYITRVWRINPDGSTTLLNGAEEVEGEKD